MTRCWRFKRAALSLLALLLSDIATAVPLKVVADYWPPFTSDKPGERVAVDLVEQALQRAGIARQGKITDWEDVLDGVRGGKYDAIVGAWKNAQRETFLVFSRPYLENRLMLVGRVDNKLDFRDVGQLESHTVGIISGYAYGEAILNNEKIEKVPSASIEENIKRLLDKEVEFILIDSLVAEAMGRQLPEEIKTQFVIYPTVVDIHSLHFAVRKNHPEAVAIIEKFNKAIEGMIVDGSYNRLLGFDWLVADTNADGVDEFIVGDYVSDTAMDPSLAGSGYTLFSPSLEMDLDKKRPVRYRILENEYNTWGEAQQAISEAIDSGTVTREDTRDAVGFTIGRF